MSNTPDIDNAPAPAARVQEITPDMQLTKRVRALFPSLKFELARAASTLKYLDAFGIGDVCAAVAAFAAEHPDARAPHWATVKAALWKQRRADNADTDAVRLRNPDDGGNAIRTRLHQLCNLMKPMPSFMRELLTEDAAERITVDGLRDYDRLIVALDVWYSYGYRRRVDVVGDDGAALGAERHYPNNGDTARGLLGPTWRAVRQVREVGSATRALIETTKAMLERAARDLDVEIPGAVDDCPY